MIYKLKIILKLIYLNNFKTSLVYLLKTINKLNKTFKNNEKSNNYSLQKIYKFKFK